MLINKFAFEQPLGIAKIVSLAQELPNLRSFMFEKREELTLNYILIAVLLSRRVPSPLQMLSALQQPSHLSLLLQLLVQSSKLLQRPRLLQQLLLLIGMLKCYSTLLHQLLFRFSELLAQKYQLLKREIDADLNDGWVIAGSRDGVEVRQKKVCIDSVESEIYFQ